MDFGGELTDELLHESNFALAIERDHNFALAIERDQFWIQRRVDSIQLQSPHANERHVTLDIDVKRVRAHAQVHAQRALLLMPKTVLVPIMVLPKELLLDFDARDSDGRSLSVATREADARFAALTMVASLIERGVSRDKLTPCIVRAIYNAAGSGVNKAEPVTRETKIDNFVSEDDDWKKLSDNERATAGQTWSELLKGYPEFLELLQKYTKNFMAMVPVDLSQDVEVVKFRYVETSQPPNHWKTDLFGKLGFSWTGVLDMPHIGSSSREHVRIQAPEGLQIGLSQLYKVKETDDPGYKFYEITAKYEHRSTLQQLVVYTKISAKDVEVSPYRLAVTMEPRCRGFVRQSMWLCTVSFLMLLGGALAEFFGRLMSGVSPGDVSKESVVLLFLIVPTLLLALMARDGEAEIVSTLLLVPRIVIALTAAANVCAGTALALGAKGFGLAVVWFIASGFAFISAALLFAISRTSSVSERHTLKNAGYTQFPQMRIWEMQRSRPR